MKPFRVIQGFPRRHDRVRIKAGVRGPNCRDGIVIETQLDQGRCLVQHDEYPYGPFSWGFDELEIVKRG